jgi:hypothetical protein
MRSKKQLNCPENWLSVVIEFVFQHPVRGQERMLQSPIVVSTIADDIEIRALFRARYWEVDDGIDFLLGIYSVKKVEDGFLQVKTLDGNVYTGPECANQIDDLLKRHDVMKKIWVNSTQAEKGSKSFFIRWGIKNKDICRLFWLEDAVNQGLLPASLLLPKKQSRVEAPEEKSLNSSEKRALLKIIAALAELMYCKPFDEKGVLKRGLMAEILKDILSKGFTIEEETLNKHLKAAWEQNYKKT